MENEEQKKKEDEKRGATFVAIMFIGGIAVLILGWCGVALVGIALTYIIIGEYIKED